MLSRAIVNARVWTGNPSRPWAEAIGIAGDRIALVGATAEVRKAIAARTDVIDAAGGFVVPGFIDAHLHFLTGGFALDAVQLRSASTREVFVSRIAERARLLPAGQWITHGDWDHELWGGALPSRDWIDAVTPNHPVWINRLDLHMALANSAALRLAGISRDLSDVQGGWIGRTANGELTGIFRDNAMALVQRVLPAPTETETDAALERAMTHVASLGVTSVHHMGFWDDVTTFRRAHATGRLRTRIYAAVPLATHERLAHEVRAHGSGDAWLRIGLLKSFVDGSLGSHTAAMLEPYSDAPGDTGLFVSDPEEMFAQQCAADAAGLQLAVHAIGDAAVRRQLDCFERIQATNGDRDRRWRIEHAQHVHPSDVPRFGELGVIASVQPYHAVEDGKWAERLIGAERVGQSYAFRSLSDAGALLAMGSDWVVAPPSPVEGIYAAVTRRTLDGAHPGGWVPEQRLNLEEALAGYTRQAAYAGLVEQEVGMIVRGMLADLVILDRDLFRVSAEELERVTVRCTIVGGEPVFRAS